MGGLRRRADAFGCLGVDEGPFAHDGVGEAAVLQFA